MAAMSVATVLTLIATQRCLPPPLARTMTGIALHESGLDPTLIRYNRNGTFDAGLTQVNSANFGWLGLTLQDALDPCKNLAAGAKVLLAKYNGSSGRLGMTIGATYATNTEAAIRKVEAVDPSTARGAASPNPGTGPDGDLADEPEGVGSTSLGDDK
jgi:hypothetical protein